MFDRIKALLRLRGVTVEEPAEPTAPALVLPGVPLLNQYPCLINADYVFFSRALREHNDEAARRAWDTTRVGAVGIFAQRLPIEVAGRIDRRVLVLVGFLIDRPAIAVLWAYTLFKLAERVQGDYYLAQFLADFPDGFPTDASYYQAWSAQKNLTTTHENFLDDPRAWT